MAEPRRMNKSELFAHFAERFGIRRAEASEFFDELQQLTEQELLRCGEFLLPGVAKLVVQKRERRMGPEPGDRGEDRDPGQAGGQGAHREAAQGCGRSVDAVPPHAVRSHSGRFGNAARGQSPPPEPRSCGSIK